VTGSTFRSPLPTADGDYVSTASSATTPRSRVGPLVLLALSAASGLAMTFVIAVQTRVGQIVDTRAMVLVAQTFASTHWTATWLGLISPTTVTVAIAMLGVLVCVAEGVAASVATTVTAAGTVVAAIALKALLHRPMLLDASSNSFPSGHVAAVAGLAAAVALATSKAVRPMVLLAGFGAVALTGLATVALRWHRPSDVLASALLAIGVAAATRSALAIYGRQTPTMMGKRTSATGPH
jgi:membrane-associated phospholipid phosphatase